MVYWCLYTLRFNLGIYELYSILWQMLSHLMLFLIIALTDVIIKVTVADFIATFFWQMLLPLMCEMVFLPTILICVMMLTTWQMLFPAPLLW